MARKISTMTTHAAMKVQWKILRLEAFCRASCRFMISSFSDNSLISAGVLSVTVSPSNVLTGVSSTSEIVISISESGTDKPRSHLETVWRTTFSFIASSSCERPFDCLTALMFSFILTSDKSRFVFLLADRHPVAQTCPQSLLCVHHSTKNKARQFYQNYRAFLPKYAQKVQDQGKYA